MEEFRIGDRVYNKTIYNFNDLIEFLPQYELMYQGSQSVQVPSLTNQFYSTIYDERMIMASNSSIQSRTFYTKETRSVKNISKEIEKVISKYEQNIPYSIDNLSRCIYSFLIKNKNFELFKSENKIYLIETESIRLYRRFTGSTDPIHYAIADLDPMIYSLSFETKHLTKLEQEIEDLNTIGFRE